MLHLMPPASLLAMPQQQLLYQRLQTQSRLVVMLPTPKSAKYHCFQGLLRKVKSEEPAHVAERDELEEYLSEPQLDDPDVNVLRWWQVYRSLPPIACLSLS